MLRNVRQRATLKPYHPLFQSVPHTGGRSIFDMYHWPGKEHTTPTPTPNPPPTPPPPTTTTTTTTTPTPENRNVRWRAARPPGPEGGLGEGLEAKHVGGAYTHTHIPIYIYIYIYTQR